MIGVDEEKERTAAEYHESCQDDVVMPEGIAWPEGLLCLKGSDEDSSTENGDSGGPLLHKSIDLADEDKCDSGSRAIHRWHLAGITSGGDEQFSYFVNVTFSDWTRL